MISFHFPPESASGAVRVAKFAKYLQEFNWEPYVLTVKEEYYGAMDRGELFEVPFPQRVFRSAIWPTPWSAYIRLRKWMGSLRGHRRHKEEIARTSISSDPVESEGVVQKMLRVLRSLLRVAGEAITWAPPATFKASSLVRRYQINCLYTSGPPHSAHLIGLMIKGLYGVRWIADFRDQWARDAWVPAHVKSGLSERIEGWMEKQVIRSADKVISVTESKTHELREFYPTLDKDKFITIANGYDAEDFASLQRSMKYDKFRMTHLGSLGGRRTPAYFLRAVRELIDEQKLTLDDLEIRFIGACFDCVQGSVESLIQGQHLSSIAKILQPLPYKEALQEMVDSDVLLLFALDQPLTIPAKAFEYIASGTDIITFTSEGETASLMREAGRGLIVEPDSIEQMKSAIESSYRKFKSGNRGSETYVVPQHVANTYSRRNATRVLVSLLQS
jgi:glycosyltransferase involved in cell wall biosynthesis